MRVVMMMFGGPPCSEHSSVSHRFTFAMGRFVVLENQKDKTDPNTNNSRARKTKEVVSEVGVVPPLVKLRNRECVCPLLEVCVIASFLL